MKRPFYRAIIMGAVAAALTLSGCKKDSVEDAKDPDLKLNEESIDLKIGETFNLKVTNLPEGASEMKIRWASDDDKVATVDQNGLVLFSASFGVLVNNVPHRRMRGRLSI